MNYRKTRIQPIMIYEAFQLQMKRGDIVSRYIVESMDKEKVIKLIEGVHIPSTTMEAIIEGHRYGNNGRRWFEIARLIKLVILPIILLAFSSVFFLSLLLLVGTQISTGLKTMLWSGALFSLYMACYYAGQGFIQLAIENVIKAATITANLEVTGEME